MAEHLAVKCKACGEEFPSPIAMDRGSFQTATLTDNQYQCAHCRQMRSYDKADHYFVSA
jgi:DNA-directed RNA polymerase subunit RPC12/RpoP